MRQTRDDGTRSATLIGSRGPGAIFSSAFFIPAGVFDGADADTVIIGTAIGPWRTDYVDAG